MTAFARLVRAQVRVDEVDDDLAPGDAALLVDELRPGPHRVDRRLEEPRDHRVLDVGDHGQADLLVGDPDVRGLRLSALRSGRGQHRSDHRDDDDDR